MTQPTVLNDGNGMDFSGLRRGERTFAASQQVRDTGPNVVPPMSSGFPPGYDSNIQIPPPSEQAVLGDFQRFVNASKQANPSDLVAEAQARMNGQSSPHQQQQQQEEPVDENPQIAEARRSMQLRRLKIMQINLKMDEEGDMVRKCDKDVGELYDSGEYLKMSPEELELFYDDMEMITCFGMGIKDIQEGIFEVIKMIEPITFWAHKEIEQIPNLMNLSANMKQDPQFRRALNAVMIKHLPWFQMTPESRLALGIVRIGSLTASYNENFSVDEQLEKDVDEADIEDQLNDMEF